MRLIQRVGGGPDNPSVKACPDLRGLSSPMNHDIVCERHQAADAALAVERAAADVAGSGLAVTIVRHGKCRRFIAGPGVGCVATHRVHSVRLAKLDTSMKPFVSTGRLQFFSEVGGDREGDDLTTSSGRVKHLFGITAAYRAACRQDTSSRNATIHPNEIGWTCGMQIQASSVVESGSFTGRPSQVTS